MCVRIDNWATRHDHKKKQVDRPQRCAVYFLLVSVSTARYLKIFKSYLYHVMSPVRPLGTHSITQMDHLRSLLCITYPAQLNFLFLNFSWDTFPTSLFSKARLSFLTLNDYSHNPHFYVSIVLPQFSFRWFLKYRSFCSISHHHVHAISQGSEWKHFVCRISLL